ncbi:ABC transporter substrate-binding protein [Mucilaginibacter sp. RS28]|uniref:ABC transporter substrate-binding protein n=1 Tax=Mucilaginibacter straminoryzae TaxID=2932774 RepID=A0A9X2BEF6_9SPHI|nr:ABC transporter substrate-binding protein [Mucilaginibacter straminoryzae]MCJ8211353.1 ABC transporter substrate-binding protein [Mucilaginibacter straminoryzae]
MRQINIGVLIPNSGIFPIGKSFEKGLKAGLKPLHESDIEVELSTEFSGQSGVRQLGEIFDRFFNYHNSDIVTGFISNKMAEDVAVKFREKQRTLIVNNVGGQIPDITKLSENVFVNSAHLWRHAWSLGHYGVKNLGKSGMYVSSVYDAGYSFSHMFNMGMTAADPASQWSFAVGSMPPNGKLTDMEVILPHIDKQKPDFIFATFCGTETPLFLNEFMKRGLHKDIKVLGLPYLTSPFYGLDHDLHITSTQLYHQDATITPDKVFYELGLQTGEMIASVVPDAKDNIEIQQRLAELKQCFNIDAAGELANLGFEEQVTLTENHITDNGKQLNTTVLCEYESYSPTADQLRDMFKGPVFSWINPYLCV